MRVIDHLRKRFPNHAWMYDRKLHPMYPWRGKTKGGMLFSEGALEACATFTLFDQQLRGPSTILVYDIRTREQVYSWAREPLLVASE